MAPPRLRAGGSVDTGRDRRWLVAAGSYRRRVEHERSACHPRAIDRAKRDLEAGGKIGDSSRDLRAGSGDLAGIEPSSGLRAELSVGSSFGRYRLMERLGQGGMGVVMKAYDAGLDRTVALKFLRPGLSKKGEARMRREARALALLQHPSVVTVYEVGTRDGQPFIAMELVDGATLQQWARRNRHRWQEIVEVAVRAGRGIAAAHAAGLIHRDVKPSNILVDRSGRACVVDFGVATEPVSTAERREPTGEVDAPEEADGDSDDTLLWTRPGAKVGTPAFMAPEQHTGGAIDARSDQFSFCVTLYSVLYEGSPFVGRSSHERRASAMAGRIRSSPAESPVPAAVRAVLLRGLSVEPARRWPTMDALLDALIRAAHRRRRVWVGVAAGGVLGLVGVSTAALLVPEPDPASTCLDGAERVAEVWDEARADRVQEAFVAAGLPYADAAWSRMRARLDAHALEWSERYGELCRAMQDDSARSTLDAEMACLLRRRDELGALVELLEGADATMVTSSAEALAGLDPIEGCRIHAAASSALPPPPRTERRRVDRARAIVASADAALDMKVVALALERASEGVELASTTSYAPVQVEAKQTLGESLVLAGRLDEAERSLGDAALLASEIGYDRMAVSAGSSAAFVVGYRLGRLDDGQVWLRHASAALERCPPDPLLESDLRMTRAALAVGGGRLEDAIEDFEAALALRIEVLGAEHPRVAVSLSNLGGTLVMLERLDDGLRALTRAKEIWERSYGPAHPNVGTTLNGLGAMLEKKGRLDEARAHFEQALAISEDAFGPEHVNVALVLNNLGQLLVRMGQHDDARVAGERARRLFEETLGTEHPRYPWSLLTLALVDEAQERPEDARRRLLRAVTLWEQHYGPTHSFVGHALSVLGRVERQVGADAEARRHLERALAILEESGTPPQRAEAMLDLAESVWETEPSRATELVERARTELGAAARTHPELVERIEAWHAGHPPPS